MKSKNLIINKFNFILILLQTVIVSILPLTLHAQTINFRSQNLLERGVAEGYIKKVFALLPAKMRDKMKDLSIEISFDSTAGSELGHTNLKNSIVLDRFIYKTLTDPSLMSLTTKMWLEKRNAFYNRSNQELVNGTIAIPKHKTAKDLVYAVLIHELSHVYDGLQVPQTDYLKTRKKCILSAAATGFSGFQRADPSCQKIAQINTSVSTLPEYLNAAGWPERGLLFKNPEATNQKFDGSPFPYEYSSPLESFAVNMEYFLLDENFQCHRPLLYKYLAYYFQYRPFAEVSCATTKKVILSTDNPFSENNFSTENLLKMADIDPARVYQIHYLYAGSSGEMMSSWGHSMFRIIVCAPTRQTVGPECLNDLDYHIVASFGAYVGQLEVDPLAGVFGKYPSYLYFYPFTFVSKQYTEDEFRELYSLPLTITEKQKKIMIESLLEAHWSYRGKYKFMSNNCATEAFSIIQKTFLLNSAVSDASITTPKGLMNKIIELKIANAEILSNKDLSIKNGNYFPSSQVKYNKVLDKLKEQGFVDDNLSLDEYLSLAPEERTEIALSIKNKVSVDKSKISSLAFRILENLSFRKYSKKMTDKIFKSSEDNSNETVLGTENSQTDNQNLIKILAVPSGMLKVEGSYGIPMEKDIQQQISNFRKSVDLNKIRKTQELYLNLVKTNMTLEQRHAVETFQLNLDLTN
ncbi:MAG: DUF7844 domain-containing protein [Bdellovibrio sp.]